jgi:hypothetical protein
MSRTFQAPGTARGVLWRIGMATTTQPENRPAVRRLPKHGPAYTFYLFTALAVAVAIATVVGFRIAAVPHWF